MKILFDTNVILDLLLDRQPFSVEAIQLVQNVEMGLLIGYLSATTITTLQYLAYKVIGKEKANQEIKKLFTLFEIAPVNRIVLENALHSVFHDFEDAVLYEAAHHQGIQAIVTRNVKDFTHAKIPVYNPKQLLKLIAALPVN